MYDYFEKFFIKSRDRFYYKKTDSIFLGNSGIPIGIANLVLRTNIPKDIAIETIQDIFNYYKEQKLPFVWMTGPLSKPKEIVELVRKQQKVNIVDYPGMAYNLNFLPETRMKLEDFEIVKAEDKKAYIDFMNVIEDFIEGEEWKEKIFHFLDNQYALHSSNETSVFVGYHKGDPVSSSAVHYSQGVAGLYWIVTKKHARKKGYGTAMTYAPMYEAKNRGYEVIILHASEMGVHVYSKIGFKEYCNVKWIVWRP